MSLTWPTERSIGQLALTVCARTRDKQRKESVCVCVCARIVIVLSREHERTAHVWTDGRAVLAYIKSNVRHIHNTHARKSSLASAVRICDAMLRSVVFVLRYVHILHSSVARVRYTHTTVGDTHGEIAHASVRVTNRLSPMVVAM